MLHHFSCSEQSINLTLYEEMTSTPGTQSAIIYPLEAKIKKRIFFPMGHS